MSVAGPSIQSLEKEFKFTSSRSSGPGGQNVNKVNTKVTLKWDVLNSDVLNEEQRELVLKKIVGKISSEGILSISSQEKRSQIQNKQDVVLKLERLIKKAFATKKKRKPTKPSKAARKKRVDKKKKHGEKKEWRKKL